MSYELVGGGEGEGSTAIWAFSDVKDIYTLLFFATIRNPRLYRIIGKFPHLWGSSVEKNDRVYTIYFAFSMAAISSLPSFSVGSTFKVLASLRWSFFPVRIEPLLKGFCQPGKRTGIHKVVSFCKNLEKEHDTPLYLSYSVFLFLII